MPKLNLLVYLNTYTDAKSSNNPSLSNFKWNRDINGLSVENPESLAFSLAPGETKSLFDGSRTLSQDGTTEYSIALKPLTLQTYILSWEAGQAPNFRAPRTTGADATTAITAVVNGPVVTFSSTAGTPLSLILGGAVVGDRVRLGDLFNQANQGENVILALTATSFTVENKVGVAEGPIVLGADFAEQLQIYSAAGVQVGDTLKISGGFSLVTQGSYKVTSVGANFLEFYSADALPEEGPIVTQAIAVYTAAKKLVYLESNQHCSMILNGISGNEIEPIVIGNSSIPGMFMRTSVVYSMSVTNNSTSTAKLFLACVE